MRTRPFFLNQHFFSLAAWITRGSWSLLPLLSIEPSVPLGGGVTAVRIVLGWGVFRGCMEMGRWGRRVPSHQPDWARFLDWARRRDPAWSWGEAEVRAMAEQNPALRHLVMDPGLHVHYVRLLVARTLAERIQRPAMPPSESSLSPSTFRS